MRFNRGYRLVSDDRGGSPRSNRVCRHDQIRKLGIPFDEGGHVGTAGNDLPLPLPRGLQRGPDQDSAHAFSPQVIWNVGVFEDNPVALAGVAEKSRLAVAYVNFKAPGICVMCHQRRRVPGRFFGGKVPRFKVGSVIHVRVRRRAGAAVRSVNGRSSPIG